MPWFRLDDGMPDHPKLIDISPAAGWLWVCGGCYCSRLLTDGMIPKSMVPRLVTTPTRKAVAELVAAELWHDRGDHYEMHDFLEWNPSKERVVAERAAARERKAKSREKSRRDSDRDDDRTHAASHTSPSRPVPSLDPPNPPPSGGNDQPSNPRAMGTNPRGPKQPKPEPPHQGPKLVERCPDCGGLAGIDCHGHDLLDRALDQPPAPLALVQGAP